MFYIDSRQAKEGMMYVGELYHPKNFLTLDPTEWAQRTIVGATMMYGIAYMAEFGAMSGMGPRGMTAFGTRLPFWGRAGASAMTKTIADYRMLMSVNFYTNPLTAGVVSTAAAGYVQSKQIDALVESEVAKDHPWWIAWVFATH
jgi:hypothetical protein